MLEKVLVTLDGSDLAEDVLPHVESLDCCAKEIILLRVIAPPHSLPSQKAGASDYVVEPMSGSYWHTSERRERPAPVGNEYWYQDKEVSRYEAEAKDYLNTIAQRLHQKGFKAEPVVLFGNPADEILDYARKAKVGLIAMSTHGRSGVGRLVYGSVADQVLRAAPVPVLFIRSRGDEK